MRLDDVREAVVSLEARMDRRFELLEQRLDQRFSGIDQRFVGIDGRLDSMNRLLWGLIVTVAGGSMAIIAGIVAAVLHP